MAGGLAPQGALSPGGGCFWGEGSGAQITCPLLFSTCMALSSFFIFSPFLPHFAFLKPLPFILLHSTLHSPRPAPVSWSGLGLWPQILSLNHVDDFFGYIQSYLDAPLPSPDSFELSQSGIQPLGPQNQARLWLCDQQGV